MFIDGDIKSLNENPFKLIGDEWMLVTAGGINNFNTMTASWGGLGVLWQKNVSFVFVRPQRYTFEFMEKNDFYTLSFFDNSYKKTLGVCGTVSGRDNDKMELTGLTPMGDSSKTFFKQARMVLVCRKLYADNINPESFIEKNIHNEYPNNDYHRMYVGEIDKVLIKN